MKPKERKRETVGVGAQGDAREEGSSTDPASDADGDSLHYQWRVTGGKTGIPCIEIGRSLRVPRADLNRLLGHAGST